MNMKKLLISVLATSAMLGSTLPIISKNNSSNLKMNILDAQINEQQVLANVRQIFNFYLQKNSNRTDNLVEDSNALKIILQPLNAKKTPANLEEILTNAKKFLDAVLLVIQELEDFRKLPIPLLPSDLISSVDANQLEDLKNEIKEHLEQINGGNKNEKAQFGYLINFQQEITEVSILPVSLFKKIKLHLDAYYKRFADVTTSPERTEFTNDEQQENLVKLVNVFKEHESKYITFASDINRLEADFRQEWESINSLEDIQKKNKNDLNKLISKFVALVNNIQNGILQVKALKDKNRILIPINITLIESQSLQKEHDFWIPFLNELNQEYDISIAKANLVISLKKQVFTKSQIIKGYISDITSHLKSLVSEFSI